MFCLSQRERQREGEAEGEKRRGRKSKLAHMTVVLTEARRGRLLSGKLEFQAVAIHLV